MALGGAIAAIMAGFAAGAAEGSLKRKQKEDEFTRQIIKEAGLKRAMAGDMDVFENAEFKKAMGPEAIKALTAVAQSVQQQNAQTEQAAGSARGEFFGNDPLGGANVGAKIGTKSVGATTPAAALAGTAAPPAPTGPPETAMPPTAVAPTDAPAPFNPEPATPAAQPVRAAGPTGMTRLQDTLSEGQTVSGDVGGVKFSVTGQDAGKKIVAEGVKAGLPYDEIVVNAFAAGGKVPENLRSYGEAQFMKMYREHLKVNSENPQFPSVTDRQKAAFDVAVNGGGVIPDALKAQVGFSREDEHAIAGQRAKLAVEAGIPFPLVRAAMAGQGLTLSKDDETVLGQRHYDSVKQNLTKTLGHVYTPEQIMTMASTAIGGEERFIPPEDRKAVREELAMAEKTKQEMTERGQRIPRKGDLGPTPTSAIRSAREATEQRETELSGGRAGAVKKAQEDIPERASPGAQEQAITNEQTTRLIDRIEGSYKKLASNFGGPLGLRGRLTAAKAKMNRADVQEAADLQSSVSSLRAQLGHAMAGAAIGPAERELYFRVFPDLNKDSDVEFKAHLKVTKQNILDLREARAASGVRQNLRPSSGSIAPAPTPTPDIGQSLIDKYRR